MDSVVSLKKKGGKATADRELTRPVKEKKERGW